MTPSDPFTRPAPTHRATCARCGHKWTPRSPDPIMCPGCHQSPLPRKAYPVGLGRPWKCLRCGEVWLSRKLDRSRPVRCAKCHAIEWWRKAGRKGVPRKK